MNIRRISVSFCIHKPLVVYNAHGRQVLYMQVYRFGIGSMHMEKVTNLVDGRRLVASIEVTWYTAGREYKYHPLLPLFSLNTLRISTLLWKNLLSISNIPFTKCSSPSLS